MKKLISFLAVLALIFSASAETVFKADPSLDVRALSHSFSWSEDENGDFSVRSDAADMVKEAFEERAPVYGAGGLICFYAELRGNTRSLVSYPVLNVLFVNAAPVNARAVSFALDGERYDFPVSAASIGIGRSRAEALSIYLDADGAQFLKQLSACRRVSVGLWGDTQYTLTIDRDASFNNPRTELAQKSLDAAALPEGAPDFENYPFAGQTALLWETRTGVKPMMELHTLKNAITSIPGDDVFGLIYSGAPANSVRAFQEMLISKGLMMGPAQTNVTDAMLSAVKREQAKLGRIPTGCADDSLVRAIQMQMNTPPADSPEKPSYACESGMARFTIDRWWAARAVSTSAAGTAREAADGDNVLLTADGSIQALHTEEISLSWDVSAEVICNGKWAFPASVYCETDQGQSFSSTLGVLAQSRFVVMAEVPEYLVNDAESWKLNIRFGQEEFEFDLR